MQLPIELDKYRETTGNFVMYYGDIYPGSVFQFNEIPDRFFIIPPIHWKTVRELQTGTITPERLKGLGEEIYDPSVITRIIEGRNIGTDTVLRTTEMKGAQKWKQMFVFGAGASANCVSKGSLTAFHNVDYCPPLSIDLFDDKYAAFSNGYEGVNLFQSSLRKSKKTVEEYLEEEWKIIKRTHNKPLLARHTNIVYYLQQLFFSISHEVVRNFNRANLYAAFADILMKKQSKDPMVKPAIVNFNYDTILDHYLSEVYGVSLSQIDNYVDSNVNPFMLFKPHGSHNWGYHFSKTFHDQHGNNAPYYLYNNKIPLDEIYYTHIGEPLHANGWGLEGKYSINKNKIEIITDVIRHYHPAMLVPYNDKDEFVMPYHHTQRMEWFMSQMEDLILIGWKGNERKFNEALKDKAHSLKRIIIVNPEPAEVKANLSKYLGDLNKYEVKDDLHDLEALLESDYM